MHRSQYSIFAFPIFMFHFRFNGCMVFYVSLIYHNKNGIIEFCYEVISFAYLFITELS